MDNISKELKIKAEIYKKEQNTFCNLKLAFLRNVYKNDNNYVFTEKDFYVRGMLCSFTEKDITS